MGYQQTTLPLNEPSFKSQSYIDVNAGSRHNLLSSNTSSMEAHIPNMSFLVGPGTSSSLNVAKMNILDPFSDPRIDSSSITSVHPSFDPATSYTLCADPSIIPRSISRLIPSCGTYLEPSQDYLCHQQVFSSRE